MKKVIGFVVVLAIVLSAFLFFFNQEQEITDARKFKDEYESLNGKTSSTGNKYLEVQIPSDNKIVYKTADEIIDIIQNDTAVIYFGFNSCPWCRSMVQNFVEVVDDLNIENVYYVDIKDIRDTLEFNDEGKVLRTKSGTAAYLELLSLLKDYLDYYIIKDNDGNDFQTTEKRIYAPSVLVVKAGNILGLTTGISDDLTDPYTKMDDDVKKQGYDILYQLIKEIKPNNVCIDSTC